jgi:hypothetical protein
VVPEQLGQTSVFVFMGYPAINLICRLIFQQTADKSKGKYFPTPGFSVAGHSKAML